jgi:hypothetical protein
MGMDLVSIETEEEQSEIEAAIGSKFQYVFLN